MSGTYRRLRRASWRTVGGATLAAAAAMLVVLRTVAGVPLGRPQPSGPDRGPGLLPGERRPRPSAPGGCRGAPTSAGPPAWPGACSPSRSGSTCSVTQFSCSMRWSCTKRAYPTWADAAYLSFYPVAFAGLLAFPSRRRTGPERFRLLLDMGTVFVGGATFVWFVALGPAVASRPGFDLADLVIFAYPIGDLLLLFGVLSVLWRGRPALEHPAFADLRDRHAGIHRGRRHLRLHHHPLDLPRRGPGRHLVDAGADDPVRRGRMPASGRPAAGFATLPRPFAARPSVLPYLAVAASYSAPGRRRPARRQLQLRSAACWSGRWC